MNSPKRRSRPYRWTAFLEDPIPEASVRRTGGCVMTRKARAFRILVATDGSERRALSRPWSSVETVVVDKTPVKGILDEAGRFKADVIVLGWRGHGAIRRRLVGGGSRRGALGATCAALG